MTLNNITPEIMYSASGIALFGLGLFALIIVPHIFRKILALNVMGVGIFMLLVAGAKRSNLEADPVPHAMVLTGIVVAVAGTALALFLVKKINSTKPSKQGD